MERRPRPAPPPAELVIGNGDAAHADAVGDSEAERLLGTRRSGSASGIAPPAGQPYCVTSPAEDLETERLLAKRRSGSLLRESASFQPGPYSVTSPVEDLETERLLAKRRSASLLREFEALGGREPQPYAVTSPAEDAEAAARLLAKRRSASSLHSRDALVLPEPYCVASPAEEAAEAARALAKRRSIASSRDGSLGSHRDALHALHDLYQRKLSFPDLVSGAEKGVLRNQHFDEPPPPGSRRGSGAEPAAAAAAGRSLGSRRGSSCYAYHDDAASVGSRGRHAPGEGARGAVFANRRRISCLVEGAASPAIYQCNGYRCGDSHHCPEAFDDPCCGAGESEDFWVQSYYNARRKNKKAKARAKAKGAGGRRASRAANGKRLSAAPGALGGVAGDFEAGKEAVSAADQKRRWVVYIFATFVVMLVALAILMVIVSLSMASPGKDKGNATATPGISQREYGRR